MPKLLALALFFALFATPQTPNTLSKNDPQRLERIEQMLLAVDPSAGIQKMQKENHRLCVNALIDSFREIESIHKLYTLSRGGGYPSKELLKSLDRQIRADKTAPCGASR